MIMTTKIFTVLTDLSPPPSAKFMFYGATEIGQNFLINFPSLTEIGIRESKKMFLSEENKIENKRIKYDLAEENFLDFGEFWKREKYF